MTTDTRRVARSYFDAWTTRQGPEVLTPLLSPDFGFEAGPMRIEGRDAFLAGAQFPNDATTSMLAEAYEGEHAFQLYLSSRGDKQVKIVEHLTVSAGVIVSSEVITDGSAFAAFMSG